MRRIIICADGTWNEPEQVDEKTGRCKPSNVLKIARAVLPCDIPDDTPDYTANKVDQIVYYHEGVGTNGGLDKFTGGAFGHGLAVNVRVLYRFIVFNYEEGDELYFFGFSRGAFTVRTLAGFMKKVGLLKKNDEFYTPNLYKLYESRTTKNDAKWEKAFKNIRSRRPCPPIHFIGVWDTVGSLGAPGLLGQLFHRRKYKYHDIGLNQYILNAYHALAIDERRKPFRPSIWTRPSDWTGQLEQAWFPGVHSNVGGGYHPDGVANEPLHWIIEKAEKLGLAFDDNYLSYFRPCFDSELRDSMSFKYKLFGEYQRKLGAHVQDGESIHAATFNRRDNEPSHYHPKNLVDGLPVVDTTRIDRGEPCLPL